MISKPTAGPWIVRDDTIATEDAVVARVPNHPENAKNWPENARLIAEAGTVHHETGLTPQQLREQRDELLAALRNITECAEAGTDGANMDLWIDQARAALASVEAAS